MARLDTFDRDLKVMLADTLSPEARSRLFGQEARKLIEAQDSVNDRLAGRDVQFKTFVDGAPSGALERAQRVIVAEWDMIDAVLRDIHAMLTEKAPVLKGDYKRSITLFADGAAVAMDGDVPAAEEYVFVATVPYARKIERGLSRQAPEGVFEVIAALAGRRYGNMARVRFSFRSIAGSSNARANRRAKAVARDERQPAIVITPR